MTGVIAGERFAEVTPAPILHLHRHVDGYIAFATERDGDDWRPLVSIRASELENWFPLFRDQLLKDAYCSINADWRLRKYGEHGNSYGYPLHRTNCLRYINAAFVDIDFHKLGLDLGTVIGRVVNLQESGQLPHASMIVRSGQGLWLLWLIHDIERADLSQRAFPEKLDLYRTIQDAIIQRLLPVGADMAARDAVRYIRIPGSLNTGSETAVEWWIQGSNERSFIYTLPQLAGLLRAIPTRRHHGELVAHNPAKRRGWVALNARRLRNFNTLRALRGGFNSGCRNNACKIYGWLLRANAIPKSDVLGLLTEMGERCNPRLSRAEIRDAWNYTKIVRMQDQTISDWLNVSEKESEFLEGLPPASIFKPGNEPAAQPMPRDVQRRAVQERRAAILVLITELGRVPSVREMSRLINGKGFRGNHQTVFTDYKMLGIEGERTAKAEQQEEKRPDYSLFPCMQETLDRSAEDEAA